MRFEIPLPDFEAKDIDGRVWRSSDLLGKLRVIDLWSTFSPNFEHPEVQRFFDRIRQSQDIELLRFCSDYDYTHAPAYMKKTQYTFPVIAD